MTNAKSCHVDTLFCTKRTPILSKPSDKNDPAGADTLSDFTNNSEEATRALVKAWEIISQHPRRMI